MAAASRLGVSLTHRDHAQAVKFITAHSRQGELPDMDWRACADEKTSLIVYMGARTAPKLAEVLLANDLPENMPVIIAKGISRASEDISYHILGDLVEMEIDRTQPVLIGIGHVFKTPKRLSQYNGHQEIEAEGLKILSA
jgi:uroporphyrin-III C-methyltransferase/precorrin-2 dehydrogenase/sirohydrochlorin ferrochelatase